MSPVLLGDATVASNEPEKAKKKRKRKNKKKTQQKSEADEVQRDREDEVDQASEFGGSFKKLQNKKMKFDDDFKPVLEEQEAEPEVEQDIDQDVEQEEELVPQPEQELIVPTTELKNQIDTSTLRDTRGSHSITEKQPRAKRAPKTVDFDALNEKDEDDDDEVDFLKTKKPRQVLEDKARELLKVRETLPVFKVKNELTAQILANRVVVLIGETGSGKSTQIPQFLLEELTQKNRKGAIAVTQPRRVAAINLASRVAEEYGCNLGQQVGYAVRFQNVSQSNTKLKYLTDGMLLRELMLDSSLKQYNTIVIDEAHERTILTDLLLGFLKELLAKRQDDFRIIVMSATLDAEKFSLFFDGAPILYVEGKMYPVERLYLPKSTEDVVDSMVKTLIQLNQSEQEGDILCFLPGQEEIDKCVSILSNLAPDLPKTLPYIVPLPLYAALPTSQQTKIFQPVKKRQRKIILSTNIAETSVTVPGIKYVVDSGLRKVKAWKHELGLSTLLTAPISQASATQRAGRAGRQSAGKCFRLYTESDYYKLPQQTDPEIVRSDIISPVLMLKKMNVDNLYDWPWLEHPGEKSLQSALFQLLSLGALDPKDGSVTPLGEKMTVLPLQPQLSAVLISAKELGVLGPVIDIVSCLSVDNLVLTPSNDRRDEVNERRRNLSILGSRYGDLIMLKEFFDHIMEFKDLKERQKWCRELDISYKGFKNVLRVRKQLRDYMSNLFRDEVSELDDEEDEDFVKKPLDTSAVLKSFLKGYITNTAIGMPDRSYRTVMGGNLISIHPSSLLFGSKLDCVMYIEYVFTTKGYARNCSRIELSWLQEVAPHLLGTRISAK